MSREGRVLDSEPRSEEDSSSDLSDFIVDDEEPKPAKKANKKKRVHKDTPAPAGTPPPAPKKSKKVQPSPAVNWVFTHNNYPIEWDAYSKDEWKANVAKFYADTFNEAGIQVVYLIGGKEEAPTTGTRHVQGFFSLASKLRKTALIKVFPKICFDVAKGSVDQNEEYCSKESDAFPGEPNPFFSTYGIKPISAGEKGREMWLAVVNQARSGNVMSIADSHPRIFLSHIKNLEHIANKYASNRPQFVNPHKHTGVWIWSKASGLGKTSAVMRQWPDVYLKAHDTQWNDYKGEDIALLDDFSRKDALTLSDQLKLWCNHLPFPGRILFGTNSVHLKHFVVTSNYSIFDLFGNLGEEIYGLMCSRFRVIDWDQYSSWRDVPLDVLSEDNILTYKLPSEL